MMGHTAKQGYADCMSRDLPEPVCTHDYYIGQLNAMRERLHQCKMAIEELKE